MDSVGGNENVAVRVAYLEEAYRELVKQVSRIEKNVSPGAGREQEPERLVEQINTLEQERLSLLEQLTSLEEQRVLSMKREDEFRAVKAELLQSENEKQRLLQQLAGMDEERNKMLETIGALERTKNAVYLEKERKSMEEEISALQRQRDDVCVRNNELEDYQQQLLQKIQGLESQPKAMIYLEKKNELLTEELSSAMQEKERLKKDIARLEQERTRLQESAGTADKLRTTAERLTRENCLLTDRIAVLEQENIKSEHKIKVLEEEKDKLAQERKNKYDELKAQFSEEKQRLIDQVREMDQERLKLFAMIGEMEESKKVVPYLDKKIGLLEEELKQAQQQFTQVQAAFALVEKERNDLLDKISVLEEKRNTRLRIEQDNGKLQKRIAELEAACAVPEKQTNIAGPQPDDAEYKKIRRELIREHETCAQALEELEQQKHRSEERIAELVRQNRDLLDQLAKAGQPPVAAYVLDKEKLDDLKEFTLEAIQARRWKNPEFINGAYDAIGLFYRTLLADRPIKKKIK
ncbi:MAG: hypothetical protein PHO30_04105 [Candidatus Omnitrophica bacterium]|nr:hypothetical protein [Candidatus Omnitrophota bacterium]